jgi:serine/threonine protein kinase
MEYLESGSLLDYLSPSGRLSEVQARRYFCQIFATLEYLDDVRKIAHRDLKPEHILFDRHYNLRLIDFGLNDFFSDEIPDVISIWGSLAYAAPELLNGHHYTKAVDIWSTGLVLYSFVTSALPFEDPVPEKMLKKIACSHPLYPDLLSPSLIDLLRKLLQKDPKRWITIQGIKAHPGFRRTNIRISGSSSLANGRIVIQSTNRWR